MGDDRQLDLFGANAEPDPRLSADAERLLEAAQHVPSHVRLGTSSWTFPGWKGLVYQRHYRSQQAFTQGSLEEYAAHPLFSTVGVDRSYYAPLSAADWRNYAAQLPEGFRCVIKVWDGISTCRFPDHPRYGERRGTANAGFLDPVLFAEAVAAPLFEAFAAHTGPLVIEVPPMRSPPPAHEFERAVERFLQGAPPQLHYAFELRNAQWLTDRYLAILREHAASHVLNFHTTMPPLRRQLARAGILPGPQVVARLMLPPYTGYAQRKRDFAPFDHIVEAQPEMRDDVVRLAERAGEAGHTLHVIVNNKAEGCAPLTLAALAELFGAD